MQILSVSLEAVFLNKSRSILTALGIIFGVAAVIAMMAIGNGARQEILEQIKMVGVNNIVILPVTNVDNRNDNSEKDKEQEKSAQKKFVPGLTLKDAENIQKTIPAVERVSPEIVYNIQASRNGKTMPGLITTMPGWIEDIKSLFSINSDYPPAKVYSGQANPNEFIKK